jgi:hypothetical protein
VLGWLSMLGSALFALFQFPREILPKPFFMGPSTLWYRVFVLFTTSPNKERVHCYLLRKWYIISEAEPP